LLPQYQADPNSLGLLYVNSSNRKLVALNSVARLRPEVAPLIGHEVAVTRTRSRDLSAARSEIDHGNAAGQGRVCRQGFLRGPHPPSPLRLAAAPVRFHHPDLLTTSSRRASVR